MNQQLHVAGAMLQQMFGVAQPKNAQISQGTVPPQFLQPQMVKAASCRQENNLQELTAPTATGAQSNKLNYILPSQTATPVLNQNKDQISALAPSDEKKGNINNNSKIADNDKVVDLEANISPSQNTFQLSQYGQWFYTETDKYPDPESLFLSPKGNQSKSGDKGANATTTTQQGNFPEPLKFFSVMKNCPQDPPPPQQQATNTEDDFLKQSMKEISFKFNMPQLELTTALATAAAAGGIQNQMLLGQITKDNVKKMCDNHGDSFMPNELSSKIKEALLKVEDSSNLAQDKMEQTKRAAEAFLEKKNSVSFIPEYIDEANLKVRSIMTAYQFFFEEAFSNAEDELKKFEQNQNQQVDIACFGNPPQKIVAIGDNQEMMGTGAEGGEAVNSKYRSHEIMEVSIGAGTGLGNNNYQSNLNKPYISVGRADSSCPGEGLVSMNLNISTPKQDLAIMGTGGQEHQGITEKQMQTQIHNQLQKRYTHKYEQLQQKVTVLRDEDTYYEDWLISNADDFYMASFSLSSSDIPSICGSFDPQSNEIEQKLNIGLCKLEPVTIFQENRYEYCDVDQEKNGLSQFDNDAGVSAIAGLFQAPIIKYGFKLWRNTQQHHSPQQNSNSKNIRSNYVLFVSDSQEEAMAWLEALSCYVVDHQSIENKYEFQKKLGEGSYGSVFLGAPKKATLVKQCWANSNVKVPSRLKKSILNNKNDENNADGPNEYVAIKMLRKQKILGTKMGLKSLLNEIRVHWALEQCEGVLQLLGIHEDREIIFLILEYQPQGTLMNTLQKQTQLPEQNVKVIMEQILLTLDLFQVKKVVHRDIKLDNILIKQIEQGTQFEVRVADFGLACITSKDEKLFHKCGSPGYVAPEVFKNNGYSYKVDVFSLGSVFFNLLTGRFLFCGETADACLKQNAKCDISQIKQVLSHTSFHCRDLLMWMLEADPDERPTAKEALKHPWFKDDKDIIKDLLKKNNVLKTPELGGRRTSIRLPNLKRMPNSPLIGSRGLSIGGMIQHQSNWQVSHMGSFQVGNTFFRSNLAPQTPGAARNLREVPQSPNLPPSMRLVLGQRAESQENSSQIFRSGFNSQNNRLVLRLPNQNKAIGAYANNQDGQPDSNMSVDGQLTCNDMLIPLQGSSQINNLQLLNPKTVEKFEKYTSITSQKLSYFKAIKEARSNNASHASSFDAGAPGQAGNQRIDQQKLHLKSVSVAGQNNKSNNQAIWGNSQLSQALSNIRNQEKDSTPMGLLKRESVSATRGHSQNLGICGGLSLVGTNVHNNNMMVAQSNFPKEEVKAGGLDNHKSTTHPLHAPNSVRVPNNGAVIDATYRQRILEMLAANGTKFLHTDGIDTANQINDRGVTLSPQTQSKDPIQKNQLHHILGKNFASQREDLSSINGILQTGLNIQQNVPHQLSPLLLNQQQSVGVGAPFQQAVSSASNTQQQTDTKLSPLEKYFLDQQQQQKQIIQLQQYKQQPQAPNITRVTVGNDPNGQIVSADQKILPGSYCDLQAVCFQNNSGFNQNSNGLLLNNLNNGRQLTNLVPLSKESLRRKSMNASLLKRQSINLQMYSNGLNMMGSGNRVIPNIYPGAANSNKEKTLSVIGQTELQSRDHKLLEQNIFGGFAAEARPIIIEDKKFSSQMKLHQGGGGGGALPSQLSAFAPLYNLNVIFEDKLHHEDQSSKCGDEEEVKVEIGNSEKSDFSKQHLGMQTPSIPQAKLVPQASNLSSNAGGENLASQELNSLQQIGVEVSKEAISVEMYQDFDKANRHFKPLDLYDNEGLPQGMSMSQRNEPKAFRIFQ